MQKEKKKKVEFEPNNPSLTGSEMAIMTVRKTWNNIYNDVFCPNRLKIEYDFDLSCYPKLAKMLNNVRNQFFIMADEISREELEANEEYWKTQDKIKELKEFDQSFVD